MEMCRDAVDERTDGGSLSTALEGSNRYRQPTSTVGHVAIAIVFFSVIGVLLGMAYP